SQVRDGARALDRTDAGLEHQVERARFGELPVALAGMLARPLEARRLVQLVRAEPPLALLAVDHRIREPADVTRRLPHLRVLDDRGVETDDVVARGDHAVPPRLLDAALQLD